MKIRDWIHAIDLTIGRYREAIERNFPYIIVAKLSKETEWKFVCPLCEYAYRNSSPGENKCYNCIWYILENRMCYYVHDYDAFIQKLRIWKKILKRRKI